MKNLNNFLENLIGFENREDAENLIKEKLWDKEYGECARVVEGVICNNPEEFENDFTGRLQKWLDKRCEKCK